MFEVEDVTTAEQALPPTIASFAKKGDVDERDEEKRPVSHARKERAKSPKDIINEDEDKDMDH